MVIETLNNNKKRFACDHCEYYSDHKGHLKQHLSNIHDIGVNWFDCPEDGCDYKSKMKGHLKQHLSNIHDIGVNWFDCPEDGCDYKSKSNGDLKQHLSNIHDIGVSWFHCTEDGCDYKSKANYSLKRHLANIHNIGTKWFHCPEENCNHKCKNKGDLKKHLSNIHGIGVTWFHCPEDGCDYKSKANGVLKRHQRQCMGQGGVGSNGEKYVKQCLSDLGFLLDEDYVFNQSFQPLSQYTHKQLRPDFRFLDHDIIIEYDGEQHFKPKGFGGISKEQAEENFKETQENDKLKDDFCRENGFKMIRIPYTKFSDTLSILSVELHDIVDWTG